MSDLIFTDLILTILAFITGAIVANLYSRVLGHDIDETLAEASRVIPRGDWQGLVLNLQAENERLTAELQSARAELGELRQRLAGLRTVRKGPK